MMFHRYERIICDVMCVYLSCKTIAQNWRRVLLLYEVWVYFTISLDSDVFLFLHESSVNMRYL